MRKFFVMIVALAAMAVPGAFANVAHAGCLADAKADNYDSVHSRFAGHGGITCTTGNGTSYQLVLYHQEYNSFDGLWHTASTGVAYPFSNGGNPMPNGYVSGDKVNYFPCSEADIGTGWVYIRVHATLRNLTTNQVDTDDGPATVIGSDCESI